MIKTAFKILVFMSLIHCGNFIRSKHTPSGVTTDQSSSTSTIAFAEVRDKIFSPKCVECHIQYADYNFVKKDLTAILNSVEQNRMPRNSPLDDGLKKLLKDWIDMGAASELIATEPDAPVPIDTLQATWDSLYANIFIPKCVVCHSPNGEAPWVDVSSRIGMSKTLLKHIDFKNPRESTLIVRLADPEEPMPPLPPFSNISQLTPAEVDVVVEWIKNGLP